MTKVTVTIDKKIQETVEVSLPAYYKSEHKVYKVSKYEGEWHGHVKTVGGVEVTVVSINHEFPEPELIYDSFFHAFNGTTDATELDWEEALEKVRDYAQGHLV